MSDFKPLEAVRRTLASSIANLAFSSSGHVEQLGQARASVENFRDLGAMSDIEADRWLSVIDLAEDYVDDWPYASEAVRQRAREYLRSLIPTAPTNEDPEPFWQAQEFFGCIRALSRTELSAIEAEFDHARGADEDEDDEGDGEPLDSSEILRTELGPSEYVGGVCITSVQVAAGGALVHWHTVKEGESQGWRDEDLDSLTDDLGTEYDLVDSNSHQLADHASLGTAMYSPAIPKEATELRVRIWGHELLWPLQ